tara:strand:+ start:20039 stop:21475 length:1437 start_codon:yes stop_codon:yes gene_type:complete
MSNEIKNICCIGAGYVGGPTMSVIADKCSKINVNVVDKNSERIALWNSQNLESLPIYEPGLDKIIERCRGENLTFSTKIQENISSADIIFISVNTPTKTKGIGAGQASDLKWVEACAREVAKFANGHTIVVEKSTLPVKTAEVIKNILEASQPNSNERKKTFAVLSNPEFLSEGSAIRDLEEPDRVLIGGENNDAIMALSNIYRNWIPKEKILHTNIWSSELSKLTANAFLAQRISSINSISALCESTGADVREVSRAIGLDSRIGSKFLDSGPGFGGSCFKKDILNLVYLSRFFDLHAVADFWEGVVKLNTWHQHRLSKLIIQNLFGTISGKKICVLGFAFKANTNDTRESASINICKDLLEEGAFLSIHDPKVSEEQIQKDLKIESLKSNINSNEIVDFFNFEGKWIYENSIYKAVESSDAVVVLTEWEEYTKINWEAVSKTMRKPSWIFDARSILDKKQIIKNDLFLWRIGDGNK